jgi:hypothetical protein
MSTVRMGKPDLVGTLARDIERQLGICVSTSGPAQLCQKALLDILGKATFASTYGAAASIVVPIVWVYYSAQIFFLGAEFTKTFADCYGSQPGRGRSVEADHSAIRPGQNTAGVVTPSGSGAR